MSFLPVFRDVLHISEAVAPAVATAINPVAGALVSLVVEGVTKAESAGGSGLAKKEQVMQDLLPAGTAVVNTLLHARGINLSINAGELSTALGSLVDGVVTLLNALGPAPSAPSSRPPTAAV